MLSAVVGFVSNDLAIDVGTANTRVCVPRRGVVLEEPSVVAISRRGDKRRLIAVGREAKAMLGRVPDGIDIVRPMRDGVIADLAVAEEMIKHFIHRVRSRSTLFSPQLMLNVPGGATQVERRAMLDAALASGARHVYLIEAPAAAALGIGVNVLEPRGSMVVDIGGGITDIAVMTLGRIIYSRAVRTAGEAFDEAIMNRLRRKHNVLIGEATAETLKIDCGSAILKANGAAHEIAVKGRDLRRGLPTEIKIDPADLVEALEQSLLHIADAIQTAIERIPPELAADIYEDGIVLTGGGALLDKIDVKLARQTGVKFTVPPQPMHRVAIGGGRALERVAEIEPLLATAA